MKQSLWIRQLLLPAAIFLLVLIVSISWLYQRLVMVESVQQQGQQVQAALTEANQKINQSVQDKQWAGQYLKAYTQLQRSGFVGDDQRLTWYQTLVATSSRLKLSDVSFDIAPQQLNSPALPSGTLQLMVTPVHFTAEIPHEGVFAQLLEDLRVQEHGIFTVSECTLTLASESLPLQTHCLFEWHTLTPEAKS